MRKIPCLWALFLGIASLTSCQQDQLRPDEVFLKLYGDGISQRAAAVKALPDGGFLLMGSIERNVPTQSSDPAWGVYVVRTDREGNALWRHVERNNNFNLFGVDMEKDPGTNEFAIIAHAIDPFTREEAVFFFRINDGGSVQERGLPDLFVQEDQKEIPAVIRAVEGPGPLSYVVCGTTSRVSTLSGSVGDGDPSDVLMMGLDRDGGLLWRNVYGRSGEDHGADVTSLPDGGLLFLADSKEGGGNSSQLLLIETNENGIIRDGRLLEATGDERASSLLARPDGIGFAVAGIRDGDNPFLYSLGANLQRTNLEDARNWAPGADFIRLEPLADGFITLTGSLPGQETDRVSWLLLITDLDGRKRGLNIVVADGLDPHSPAGVVTANSGFAICGTFKFDRTDMVCLLLTDASGKLQGAK